MKNTQLRDALRKIKETEQQMAKEDLKNLLNFAPRSFCYAPKICRTEVSNSIRLALKCF